MLAITAQLENKIRSQSQNENADIGTTRSVRFLTILSIYLVILVCIQFAVILTLKSDGCPRDEIEEHAISKRGIRELQNDEQRFCPSGCVRRRRRKGMTETSTYSSTNRVHGYGQIGQSGSVGNQGRPGNAGEPGGVGYPGNAGEAGQAGRSGAQGLPGSPGMPGLPGSPGRPGQAGSSGLPGQIGYSGYPGNRGLPGTPGMQGPSGQRGYPASYPEYSSNYGLRSGTSRGDQGYHTSLRNTTAGAKELLKEFQLYAHPQCKNEVNHKALMDTFKDEGKVSFMILIDLHDNKYCIVHT